MSYSDIVLAQSPSYYFRFEGTNVVNSGSVSTTVTNGSSNTFATGGVAGDRIYSGSISGSAYGFTHPDSASIFNDKIFTIEGWIKIASNDDLEISNVFDGRYGSHIFAAGDLRFGFAKGGTSSTPTMFVSSAVGSNSYTFSSFQWNTWHHVALVADGSTLKTYFNGTEVASSSIGTGTMTADGNTKYWLKERTTTVTIKGWKGYADELAAYSTALTQSQIQARVDYIAGAEVTATALTASALLVNPTLSTSSILTATALTASAASGAHFNSTRDNFTLLDGYMSTLSLEQWYKFDEPKSITNFGTGGNPGFIYHGTAFNDESAGIQGFGALRITGTTDTSYVSATIDANINPEITDGDFSIGFWVKKSTAQSAIIFSTNDEDAEYFNVEFNSSGYLRTNAHLNNQDHAIETTTSYADGNWHYVAIRKSGSTMQMWVDNVSKGTVAITHSFENQLHGDFGTGTGTNSELMYVSQFYTATATAVTSTQIANIWTYGQPLIQGSAAMVMPKFSRDNAFNTFVQSKSPHIYFKMDTSTGLPQNSGSDSITLSAIDSSYTQDITSPNYKAFNFTDRNTQLTGSWSTTTGTYTTDNTQTILMYAKMNYAANNYIGGSAGFGGATGGGLLLQHLSSGLVRVRASDADYIENISSTSYVDDGNYHMIVAVKDGSNLSLYIDGKLEGTSTSSLVTLTDAGQVSIGGAPALIPPSGSRNLTIDEFAVFSTAFSAEEVLNAYQAIDWATDWTATAAIVAPTYSAGFGPIITETPSTATASMGPVFPPIAPATANGLFQQPNFEAIKNVSVTFTAWTATAEAQNPGWDIGENNVVIHMDASASFPNARVLIPGFWNASPAIANPAVLVEPALSSTKGARINAQPLNANGFFALPPAYYLITDDLWYQKLLDVDYQSSATPGKITFFNTNTNIYLGESYDGWTAYSSRSPFVPPYGYNLYDLPLPVASAGGVDLVNRKTLNLRNIALVKNDAETYSGGWTMETLVRTTKANQFIAGGRFLGDVTNSLSRSKRTGIRLNDGKIAFTNVKDYTEPAFNSTDDIAFTGFKSIADGEWHHLIIQYRDSDSRMQVWIDGALDIQRFGYTSYIPNQIGYNSNDANVYSDFELSAISINKGSYVLERETLINYLAAIGVTPIQAPVATATATIGVNSKGSGNRARALMLYFWPTATEQIGGKYGESPYTSTESANELTTLDYFTAPPQEYEGWDVFPVDITGKWVSELVKPEAYGVENIELTTFSSSLGPWSKPDTKTVLVNKKGSFRDLVTDASRYIDLINDIDLSQFDMIMFKNYPNDPNEKDAFTGNEIVDAYFNLRESKLFEDFLKSLRAAVDTGLSLMVANSQLALDLKIVDRVETVPDMDDTGIIYEEGTDPYAPTQVPSSAAGLPVPPAYKAPLGWKDTWKNNRTRIVNTYPGITDYPALVKTQTAFWQSTDEYRWGGADRAFFKYEHKDALAVGDEFVMSTTGALADKNRYGYLATPFANVKAGKVITAFANTVRRGLDLIDNPYKNYAQSIIVEPGDVLDGRQVGGKIYVNFTEEINKCEESATVELTSDYWVNYAYENGAISLETRDKLLAADYVTTETPYWSLDGMNLLQQAGQEFELDSNLSKPGVQKATVKTRKVNKNGGVSFQSVPTGSVFFSSTYSWKYPMASFEMPSMPTRGFRWLSNREVLEGTVIRPTALEASATMPNALGVPDKVNNFAVQSMIATATITETNYSSGVTKILALPALANATIVKPGSTIAAPTMTANASMFANGRAKVASEDQVVLQIMHVDPILYIREDVIK